MKNTWQPKRKTLRWGYRGPLRLSTERVRIPLDELADYLAAHRLRIIGGRWGASEDAPVIYLADANDDEKSE